ncbi:MAG: hypothetical protein PHD65_00680 [Gallionella sp.]|nr:hypothetical protein [Gallionella sp.]
MRLALVSLDQRWLDKEVNFARCTDLTETAAAQGCGLVIFPEMTLTGYSLDTLAIAEPADDALTLRWFGQLAHDAAVDIIFGTCLLDSVSGNPRNTMCRATSEGETSVLYAKTHPFSFAGESSVLQAGNMLGLTSVEDLRIGCSICYDLRFPELFSLMAPHCNAVVNIANWPTPRISHWRALLVARAIENQLFVFGVNRVGTDGNGLQYEESSMAIAPDGLVLEPIYSDAEIAVYDIDQAETERYREAFPTVRDKRYELYRELYEGRMQVVK